VNFLENYFLTDPELKLEVDMSYMSHKEKYEEAIRRITIVMKKIQKLQSEGQATSQMNE
jgi:acyl-CoA oxidase